MTDRMRTTMNEERWLPIPGWDGYEVSDHGRVRGVDRVRLCKNGVSIFVKGIILSNKGSVYPQANLRNCGKQRVARVHELVLETFVGPKPSGMECRHLDDNKQNNHLSNLKWGTRFENLGDDRRRNGLLVVGEKHGRSKLTEQAVKDIRKRYAAGGVLQRELGSEYGVSYATVADAIHGRSWGWLE